MLEFDRNDIVMNENKKPPPKERKPGKPKCKLKKRKEKKEFNPLLLVV